MKKFSAILLALTLSTAVTGCTTTEQGAVAGAVGGAAVGQLIGGNTNATLIGAGVGAVTGALIGESMKHKGYCLYKGKYGKTYEAPCP